MNTYKTPLVHTQALASGCTMPSVVVYIIPPSDHPHDVRDTLSTLVTHLAPLLQPLGCGGHGQVRC